MVKVNEIIRKLDNGKYRLYSHSGKNLGTYDTRAGAEKRERQVQYFKHANENKNSVCECGCGCSKSVCETCSKAKVQEVYDPEYGHDTDDHVVKHKDDNDQNFWAVYNADGKIVKVFYNEKKAKDYAEKNHDALMKNEIVAEDISDKKAMSLYNPDSETYRYTSGGGKIPNSRSVSKNDITVKSQRTDFPTGSYEPDMLAGINKQQLEKLINDALGTLRKREEMLLRARFGLSPFTQSHTMKQIGNAMNISVERVRQIEAKALRKLRHPKKSEKLRGMMDEEIADFDAQEPMASTVAVQGYGTMNLATLMKNVTSTIKQLGELRNDPASYRRLNYELYDSGVLQSKLSALIAALDQLQDIKRKGGKRSVNIQREADQVRGSEPMPAKQKPRRSASSPHPFKGRLVGEAEQQELPVDLEKIRNKIQELESKNYFTPEEADDMRRAIQAIATGRNTIFPERLLQLLTTVT
jgi:RNA polymerase sigma factor (sigma-70 family)